VGGSLVYVLKSTPTTDVIDENGIEVGPATCDVFEETLQLVAAL